MLCLDRVVSRLLCTVANGNQAWTTEAWVTTRRFIVEALVAEREAIANIQSSFTVLG